MSLRPLDSILDLLGPPRASGDEPGGLPRTLPISWSAPRQRG